MIIQSKNMRTILSLLVLVSLYTQGQDRSSNRKEIIYGRKDGLALTMMMEKPLKNSNGKAIIDVVSGNWRSGYESMLYHIEKDKPYIDSGYTVFAVIHGSQPRYAIPDEVDDIKRAVRFIRYNANEYGIDPQKIGITGASSGGHLALTVATADDKPDANEKDPVNRVSSRVQAVAVLYPPTDFLNYGRQGINPAASQALLAGMGLLGAFDFKRWNDTTRSYVSVTDTDAKLEIARQNSPIYFVSTDDPPTMIIHGDADRVVPLQQSETIIKKYEEAKVPNKLIIRKGRGHGWRDDEAELKEFVGWFNQYLK